MRPLHRIFAAIFVIPIKAGYGLDAYRNFERVRGPIFRLQYVRMQRNPDRPDAPEIPVPGTGYSLFILEEGASLFTQVDAIRVRYRLGKMGVDSELRQMHKTR